jgi:uncharacterized membrane protein
MKMTKNEYLSRLGSELRRNNVADAEDILGEYEQHFAFKLADGYSEEEIAAKLGTPQAIASQFEGEKAGSKRGAGSKALTAIALSFAALFEGSVYISFFAWVTGVAAASLASAAIGACLLLRIRSVLIPGMPYQSAALFGVSFLAFAGLLAAGAFYFFAFLKQIVKASVRWHKNMGSDTMLPPLPWSPQFSGKTRRALRTVILWSVTVFGVFSVLALVVSQFSAGALEFWHTWGWFVR